MLKLISIKSIVVILVSLSFGTVAHADEFSDRLLKAGDPIYDSQVALCEKRTKRCNAIVGMMDDFEGDTEPLKTQCEEYTAQCTWLSFTANQEGDAPYGIITDNLDDPVLKKIKAAYVEYNGSDMDADGAFHTGVANECTKYDNGDDEQLVCIKNILDVQTIMYHEAAVTLQQKLTEALK